MAMSEGVWEKATIGQCQRYIAAEGVHRRRRLKISKTHSPVPTKSQHPFQTHYLPDTTRIACVQSPCLADGGG
jgi:hypothetical protein